MVQSIGFLDKLGAADEDGGYGVEALITQLLSMISENIVDQPRLVRSNVLDGRPQTRQADQGTISIGGDVTTRFRYQDANPFLKNWFGSYDAVTGRYVAIGTTEGLSMTMAIEKKVSVWTYTGCKVHKIVIAGTPDGIMLTASLYATHLNKASSLNTALVLKGLIDPSNNAMFHHVVIRARDHGAALSDADKIKVTTFTLTLERPLDQVFVNEQQGFIEPSENNFRNITLAFVIPRYNADTWHTWKDNKTRLQFDFRMTDPISGKVRLFQFPNVEIDTASSPVGGPPSLPINITAMGSESEDFVISDGVSFDSSDNSINLSSASVVHATGTLTLTGSVADLETVTIGTDVYEADTEPGVGSITPGRIQVDVSGGSTVKAQGTLTLPTQPTLNDTMTIAGRVYTFDANGALVNTNGHIEIGANLAATQLNIEHAINRTGTPGTGYASVMVKHTQVTIAAFSANAAVITAVKGGTAGNALATTETFTAVGNVFDAATLGTTTAGVNPTAAEFITALLAVIAASGTAEVDAVQGAGTTMVATARVGGTDGNAIPTTETLTNGSWGATTLLGGTGTEDVFGFCVPGADCYIQGSPTAGNNGVAEVLTRTDHKITLAALADGGLDLTTEAAGALVQVVTRSPDVIAYEL